MTQATPQAPEPGPDEVLEKLRNVVPTDPTVRRRQMRALLRAVNTAGESV